jgi:hypothetical protein
MDLEYVMILSLIGGVIVLPILRWLFINIPACLRRQYNLYRQWARIRHLSRNREFRKRNPHKIHVKPGGVRPGRPKVEVGKADDKFTRPKKKRKKKHHNPTTPG